MDIDEPHCTPGLTAYQLMMDKDRRARLQNQQRLRDLKRSHAAEVEIVCSHDVTEFERVAGRRYNRLPVVAAVRDLVDEASQASFPASDPPFFSPTHAGMPHR